MTAHEAAEPVGPDAVSPPATAAETGGNTRGSPPVGWDLSHVRAGLLTTGVLAVVGVPLTWLLRVRVVFRCTA